MSVFDNDLNWGNKKLDEALALIRIRYPEIKSIQRTNAGGEADRKLSGDIVVQFNDRLEMWACKFRRPNYMKFQDITIEFRNGDQSIGDWFKFKGGIVQKYVYGYANGVFKFYIIDVKKMMAIGDDRFNTRHNEKHGSSSFKCISINELVKNGCIDSFIDTENNKDILKSSFNCSGNTPQFISIKQQLIDSELSDGKKGGNDIII